MADDEKKKLEEEKKRKQAEIERKRAEVRARMEEASKAKKAKKGFMTPERKKKLRLLLRKKAAEELKKEQERKAAERRRIIEERCGKPKLIDDANEGQLKKIVKDYYDRMYICEEQKWDLEREVRKRDWEIADLNSQVNDLRGKFVKPTLKKVSKYENKFAKLQKKAAEFNFRNQLKVVKKKEFTLEEEDKESASKADAAAKKKPDWSKKGDEKKEGEEGEEGQPPAEGAPPAEGEPGAEGKDAAPAVEGAQPAEGAVPAEGATPEEGAPPAEGAAPVEGAPPAEGVPAESEAAEGAPVEGAPAEEPPKEESTPGFETFKQIVIDENYDIVALPETVLAPTDNRQVVSIPNYSLVENRKHSGDGVVLYIKNSLKYKVVDLTSDNPEDHEVHFDQLLEKLKQNAQAAAEGATSAEGEAPAAPAEGAVEAPTAPTETPAAPAETATEAPPAEAAPAEATAEAPPTEPPAEATPTEAPPAETPAPTEAPDSESAPAEALEVVAEPAKIEPASASIIEAAA